MRADTTLSSGTIVSAEPQAASEGAEPQAACWSTTAVDGEEDVNGASPGAPT